MYKYIYMYTYTHVLFIYILIDVLQACQKRVRFQETSRETFTILKSWKSCHQSSEEVCMYDDEFSEDGEESLV